MAGFLEMSNKGRTKNQNQFSACRTTLDDKNTVCPRSLAPFYVVSYCIKSIKISGTCGAIDLIRYIK